MPVFYQQEEEPGGAAAAPTASSSAGPNPAKAAKQTFKPIPAAANVIRYIHISIFKLRKHVQLML